MFNAWKGRQPISGHVHLKGQKGAQGKHWSMAWDEWIDLGSPFPFQSRNLSQQNGQANCNVQISEEEEEEPEGNNGVTGVTLSLIHI